MSAEPAPTPQEHIIPQVEMQSTCSKVIATHRAYNVMNVGSRVSLPHPHCIAAAMYTIVFHLVKEWNKNLLILCFPQGILENAIKITNEPPTGMHANLHAALDNFDQVSVCLLSASSPDLFIYLLIRWSLSRTSWTSAAVSRSSRPSCSLCVTSTPVWQRGGSLDPRAGTESIPSTLET